MAKSRLIVATFAVTALLGACGSKEDLKPPAGEPAPSSTIGELASQGFEIKAAAPNGSRYVVFMQNDKTAYACEFVNTTTTQCRQIN